MKPTQRLPASLTPLDVARGHLLEGLKPVPPIDRPLADALRSIAAEMPPLAASPARDIAAVDGFALSSRDLVGASSYSPAQPAVAPRWVEAGDVVPEGCDCVLDADALELAGPIAQVMAETVPGQGVRRAGSDIAAGSSVAEAGRRILPRDLLLARAAGLKTLRVRRPRLRIVNSPGGTLSTELIAESAHNAGADVIVATAAGRDTVSFAKALDAAGCDLLLTIGGSGVGRSDATVRALAEHGKVMGHGIALQPGRTSAVGRIGATPVLALPGAPDQAFAAWWTLGLPALDRLSGRRPRKTLGLPLARKIASSVGIAEIVLLERADGTWTTLAVGELSLQAIARAEAWLVIPGAAEGFAAGAPVDAFMLRE